MVGLVKFISLLEYDTQKQVKEILESVKELNPDGERTNPSLKTYTFESKASTVQNFTKNKSLKTQCFQAILEAPTRVSSFS